jgi:transcriptional regulator with XRE-family HTH domain
VTRVALTTATLTRASSPPPAPAGASFGELLRHWRGVRRTSQLELASEAMTTPRYVSFVETGRSRPSRQMVLRLARALDVPLRDRNALLLAAGFAPVYTAEPLHAPQQERVQQALAAMLDQHEPLPAVVMDRGWNVLATNRGAAALFGRLLGGEAAAGPANVLRLFIGPGPVRDHVTNWSAVAPALLERARREAVGGVLDPATATLVDELRARPEVAALLADPPPVAAAPVIDVRFTLGAVELSFFSVVSSLGTPIDVTAQELRVEAFFPSDDATRAAWVQLAGE